MNFLHAGDHHAEYWLRRLDRGAPVVFKHGEVPV